MLASFLLLALFQPDFTDQARAACVARLGETVTVPGISVEDAPGIPGDLPYLIVREASRGAFMHVYYDERSKAAARSRATCLGAQLPLLTEFTHDDRLGAQWFSAVFVAGDYIPPRDGGVSRWTVRTDEGALSADAENMISRVFPHEQVHSFQKRAGGSSPRWFHEGHATWVGLKVSEVIRPEAAADEVRDREAAAATGEPVHLGQWGGVHVAREAIMRQASPEDRARMQADPAFTPPGPFTFTAADMVSDESDMAARYTAAWRLFGRLEGEHGADAVALWAADVTAAPGRVASSELINRARLQLHTDLTVELE